LEVIFLGARRPGQPGGLEVDVYDNNIDKALRQLKKKMATEGIYREFKKRRYYEKPSEKRKRKKAEARKRRSKAFNSEV
jgi:small subunit ribosomal protein S21